MSVRDAIDLDCAGAIVEAARAYELVLEEGATNEVARVNLAVLYWQATDFGFSSSRELPVEFIQYAGRRASELLNPKSIESAPSVEFWRKYIDWCDFGGKLEIDECLKVMERHPDYKEPAFFIFAASNGEQCRNEAISLIEKGFLPTVRNSYVRSVIDGVEKRNKRKTGKE